MIGAECALVRNTGTDDTPVWAEIKLITDVTMNDSMGQSNVSNRGSLFEIYKPGLRAIELSSTMIYDTTDTHVIAVEAAYGARTELDIAVLDAKPAVAAKGTRMTVSVFAWNRAEPLGEAATRAFTMRPSSLTKYPTPITLTGDEEEE